MRKPHLSNTLLKMAAGVLATATLAVVPGRDVALGAEQLSVADDHAPGETLGDHSTRGVVQSIVGGIIVISRPHHRGDMTFNLTPATRREGSIVVGAVVSIRYRDSRRNHIATAVAVQPKDRVAFDGPT